MMGTHDISVAVFCQQHNIDARYIFDLGESGLLSLRYIDEECYISSEELVAAEKMIRLHHDLQVNNEGIEIIFNLLDKIKDMQSEIIALKNRLRLYE